VVLQIAGQRLRLNANTDEEHLEGLARVVTERYEAMQRATRNAVPATLLALVALDLADEVQSARRKLEEELAATRRKLEEAREEARRAVGAAEARARDVEQLARRAVADAIAEIDRALADDESAVRKATEASGDEASETG
jgi:cell division protein ZapA (FtsZ GTPase activity inhibitor)